MVYQYQIDVTIKLDGCPDNGIDAVDWRREHGLPLEPTNVVKVQASGESESLCRRFRDGLSATADLIMETSSDGYSHSSIDYHSSLLKMMPEFGESRRSLYHHRISADLAKRLIGTPTEDDLAEFLQSLIDQSAALSARWREKEAARQAEEVRQREAANARIAEQQAADERKKAAIVADRNKWIEAHGSDRLKNCVKEGIECEGIYRSERLAAERPGWNWSSWVAGEWDDPRNPPIRAFSLLAEAREFDPSAKLVWWEVLKDADEIDPDDEGNSNYRWKGYAAVAEFLGREIVYGVPAEYCS